MKNTALRALAVAIFTGAFAIIGWPLWTAGVLTWLSGFTSGLAAVLGAYAWAEKRGVADAC